MTCNTKLTVFHPHLGPTYTQQTLICGTGKRLLPGRTLVVLGRRAVRAGTFLQSCKFPDHLMSSSDFICARSSIPAISVQSDVRLWGSDIPILLQYVWVYEYIPVYGTLTEQDFCCGRRDICKMIPPHHKRVKTRF